MEVIPPVINEIIQMNSELPVRAIVESDNQIQDGRGGRPKVFAVFHVSELSWDKP